MCCVRAAEGCRGRVHRLTAKGLHTVLAVVVNQQALDAVLAEERVGQDAVAHAQHRSLVGGRHERHLRSRRCCGARH